MDENLKLNADYYEDLKKIVNTQYPIKKANGKKYNPL